MNARLQSVSNPEDELLEDIAGFYDDPLGFVLFAFPWGEPGTSLAQQDGPDKWQEDVLEYLGDRIAEGMQPGAALQAAIQVAVASGHGIGKSALVCWIILWFLSTRENPQVVVTAGTQEQLRSKTWRELAKWHKLSINTHWFKWTATRLAAVESPEDWFASAVPWSESNPEAFAGTHEKHVLIIFDEASQIADIIWETAEGAMTTPGAIWIAFGNPTRNTGRFAECWGRLKHRWKTWQVDSRTAKMANPAQIEQWVQDYGEDSDFVRVRVRGLFPRAGALELISIEEVRAAMKREFRPEQYREYSLVMALDVARHGDDQSVFTRRQGFKTWPQEKMRVMDTMLLADYAAERIDTYKPDAMFIDATGLGWGVIDRLRQLGHKDVVVAVQTGEKAVEDAKYFNKRAELWVKGRDFIKEGGGLPLDNELEMDLITPQYGFDKLGRYQMESKEDVKRRGMASPDCADSFLLTFASKVKPKRDRRSDGWRGRLKNLQRKHRSPMAS